MISVCLCASNILRLSKKNVNITWLLHITSSFFFDSVKVIKKLFQFEERKGNQEKHTSVLYVYIVAILVLAVVLAICVW